MKNIYWKQIDADSKHSQYCIDQAAEALEASGYTDARLWAGNILSAIVGNLGYVEDITDMAQMAMETEGLVREVLESLYETFEDLLEQTDSNPKDVRDALVYAITSVLDESEKKKYTS